MHDSRTARGTAGHGAPGSALGGAAWTTLGIVGGLLLNFGVFVLLARLLGPAEFGVVAVAGLFVELAAILARAGIAEAIVQRAELEEEAADTAFWLCLASGLVMAVGFWWLAPWLARPFRMPELVGLLQVLSVSFVISGLSAAHDARLTRGFGFRTLALRNLAANAVSGAVAVGMALNGWGVWALIAQRLVAATVATVLAWIALPWLPRFRFSVAVARSLLGFGSRMFGTSFVLTVNGRIHEVIAGLFLDAATVGLLRVSWRCMDLIMHLTVSPAVSIALPLLSRLQADPVGMRQQMLGLMRGTSLVAFPAFLGFAAVAPSVLPLVFGPQWAEAAQVTRLFCFLVIPAVPNAFAFPMLAAMNKAHWGLYVTTAQVLIGGLMSFAAAPFGLVAMAASHVLRAYLIWPLAYAVLSRAAGLRMGTVIRALSRPLLATLLMVVPAAIAHQALVPVLGPVGTATAVGLVGATLYAGLAWWLLPDLVQPLLARLAARLPVRAGAAP